MGRQFNRFLIDVLRPPALAIGAVVRGIYWVVIGWWYEKRVAATEQSQLLQEVRTDFRFLFVEHNARIVPSRDLGHLAALECSVVTLAAEGLLFRFVRWRDQFQVHVSSERLPNKWHELASLLNARRPGEVACHSVSFMEDAARLVRSHIHSLQEAFSEDLYAEVKQRLEYEHDSEMEATRHTQDEINRKLYG